MGNKFKDIEKKIVNTTFSMIWSIQKILTQIKLR